VLYPIPDFRSFKKSIAPPTIDLMPVETDRTVFLSINRYERKKNLALAIRALGINHSYSLVFIQRFYEARSK
jgi:alpha-1,3/alpha-1,6-mannosyltransferase